MYKINYSKVIAGVLIGSITLGYILPLILCSVGSSQLCILVSCSSSFNPTNQCEKVPVGVDPNSIEHKISCNIAGFIGWLLIMGSCPNSVILTGIGGIMGYYWALGKLRIDWKKGKINWRG